MPSAAYYAAMERLAKGRAANKSSSSSSKPSSSKTSSSTTALDARSRIAADKKASQSTVKAKTSSSSSSSRRRSSSSSSSSTPSRTPQPDRRTPTQKAKGTAKTGSSASVYGPTKKQAAKAEYSQLKKKMESDPQAFVDELSTNLVAGVPPVGPGLVVKGAAAAIKGISAATKAGRGTASLGKGTPKAKEAGASGLGAAVSRSQMSSLAKQEAAMVSRLAPTRAPSPSRPSQTPQPAKTPTPARQPNAPTSGKPSRSPWDLPSPAKAPKAPFRGPVAEPEVPTRKQPEEDQSPQETTPTPTPETPIVPELDFTPTPVPTDTPNVSRDNDTGTKDQTKTDKTTKTDPGKGSQSKPPKTRTVVSPPRVRRPFDSGVPGTPNPEPFRRSTLGQEVGLAGRQPSPGSVTRSFMSSPDDNEGIQATRPLPGRSRNDEMSQGAEGLGPEERAAMLRQRRKAKED